MADIGPVHRLTPPGLGTTYEGHDPALLDTILPLVDYVETTPDSITHVVNGRAVLHEPSVRELEAAAARVHLLLHGIGLSIGSYEGWSERYLGFLDQLMARLPVAWHSEHLGYTRVDGENIGTMLALPRTEEMLDLVCERVRRIQQRYDKTFLLENIIHMLPEYPGDYTAAGFLNALVARTGCGLILDIYNLECDAHNHGFDVDAFLSELGSHAGPRASPGVRRRVPRIPPRRALAGDAAVNGGAGPAGHRRRRRQRPGRDVRVVARSGAGGRLRANCR